MSVPKIIGLPVCILLSLLVAVLTFLTGIAAGFCRLLSGFCVFMAIIFIIPLNGVNNIGMALQAFILAFLFSEYGMQTVMVWLLTKIHIAKEMLYEFVMN